MRSPVLPLYQVTVHPTSLYHSLKILYVRPNVKITVALADELSQSVTVEKCVLAYSLHRLRDHGLSQTTPVERVLLYPLQTFRQLNGFQPTTSIERVALNFS